MVCCGFCPPQGFPAHTSCLDVFRPVLGIYVPRRQRHAHARDTRRDGLSEAGSEEQPIQFSAVSNYSKPVNVSMCQCYDEMSEAKFVDSLAEGKAPLVRHLMISIDEGP